MPPYRVIPPCICLPTGIYLSGLSHPEVYPPCTPWVYTLCTPPMYTTLGIPPWVYHRIYTLRYTRVRGSREPLYRYSRVNEAPGSLSAVIPGLKRLPGASRDIKDSSMNLREPLGTLKTVYERCGPYARLEASSRELALFPFHCWRTVPAMSLTLRLMSERCRYGPGPPLSSTRFTVGNVAFRQNG